MSTDYAAIAETVERAERLAEDGATVGVRMLLLEARGMIDGALQRGEPGSETQPDIPPLLAAMVAGSKRLSDDLTLTGLDLLEARAKDAAREVAYRLVGVFLPAGTSEEQANQIADEITAPWSSGSGSTTRPTSTAPTCATTSAPASASLSGSWSASRSRPLRGVCRKALRRSCGASWRPTTVARSDPMVWPAVEALLNPELVISGWGLPGEQQQPAAPRTSGLPRWKGAAKPARWRVGMTAPRTGLRKV